MPCEDGDWDKHHLLSILQVCFLAASLTNRHREWSKATLGLGKRIFRALVYRAPVFKLNITPVTLRPTGGAAPGGG